MLHFKNILKNLSMKAKIFSVFVLASIFTLVIVSVPTFYASRAYNEKEAVESSKQIIYLISNNINTIVSNIENTWIILASSEDIQNYFKYNFSDDNNQKFERERFLRETYFKNLLSTNYIISSIIFYPAKGYPVSAGQVETPYLEGFKKFSIYNKTITDGINFLWTGTHTFEGKYFSSNINNVISVSRQMKMLGDDRIYGVLEIQLKEESLYGIFKTLNSIDGSGLIICDPEGKIVTGDQDSRKKPSDYFNTILDHIKENRDSSFKSYLSGKEYLVNFNTLKNGWKVVHFQPFSNMVSASLKLERTIFILGFIILCVVFCVAVPISSRITMPLKQLIKYSENINDANKGIINDVKNSGRELAGIYNNYNSMLRKIKESELETLRAQITPHFLYNTLNSIKCRAYLDGNEQVNKMTGALIDLLQLSINNKNEYISLKDELKITESYVLLQQSKQLEEFTVAYEVPNELNDYIVPKMIIQPLIENSIIHGMEGNVKNGEIIISASQNDGDIILSVRDNGVGMTNERIKQVLQKHESKNKMKFNRIGINNVNDRIKIYFGEKYGLQISSILGTGTDIKIRIPAIKDSNQLSKENET